MHIYVQGSYIVFTVYNSIIRVYTIVLIHHSSDIRQLLRVVQEGQQHAYTSIIIYSSYSLFTVYNSIIRVYTVILIHYSSDIRQLLRIVQEGRQHTYTSIMHILLTPTHTTGSTSTTPTTSATTTTAHTSTNTCGGKVEWKFHFLPSNFNMNTYLVRIGRRGRKLVK